MTHAIDSSLEKETETIDGETEFLFLLGRNVSPTVVFTQGMKTKRMLSWLWAGRKCFVIFYNCRTATILLSFAYYGLEYRAQHSFSLIILLCPTSHTLQKSKIPLSLMFVRNGFCKLIIFGLCLPFHNKNHFIIHGLEFWCKIWNGNNISIKSEFQGYLLLEMEVMFFEVKEFSSQ